MDLATGIDIFRFLDPKDYLRAVYETSRTPAGRCSYERFSEALGFGRNSYSHQIISGRRPISANALRRIAEALALAGRERKYFAALCQYHYGRSVADREEALGRILAIRAEVSESTLDRAQIEYFSEWFHPVVRELVALPGFDADPKAIAARLSPAITEDEAAYSFRLLQRIGYVEFDPKAGRWVVTSGAVQTASEVRSLALLRFHTQMAERARNGILEVPAAEREIGALTMSLDEQQFQELKRRIQEFRREVVAARKSEPETQRPAASRVYQLNTHLIPLTRKA